MTPTYRYSAAWFPMGGSYPTPEETAMYVPPSGAACVVKIVQVYRTSYYDVVGCRSAVCIFEERT